MFLRKVLRLLVSYLLTSLHSGELANAGSPALVVLLLSACSLCGASLSPLAAAFATLPVPSRVLLLMHLKRQREVLVGWGLEREGKCLDQHGLQEIRRVGQRSVRELFAGGAGSLMELPEC